MLRFFLSGGFMMWILLILFIVILFLSIKKIVDFYVKKDLTHPQLESGINAIIFWGIISAVLGFFVHYQGIYLAMTHIVKAEDISPAIVAQGYAMSLASILFGLFIFLFSAIIWFFLRWKYKSILGREGS